MRLPFLDTGGLAQAYVRNVMRSIVRLVAALSLSAARAHCRGFEYFFSHSKPSGNCSGQEALATHYSGGRRTASGQAFASGPDDGS